MTDLQLLERNASYDIRRSSHHGGQLRARRDISQYGEVAIRQGEVVEVSGLGFTNAGFNGITVSVRNAAGELVYNVTAGAFDVVSPR
jgi:hypothetical protein